MISSEHPWFLPKGSIRALLSFTLVVGSIYIVVQGIANGEVVHALTAMGVTHYFNSRNNAPS